MRRVRVIPVLLIQNGGLVKSIKFKNHTYIGDPINAVKIFNEKEVDEIVILDISATKEKQEPNLLQISEFAGEAFMPLSYGGGITTIEQIKSILYEGVEKVILNTSVLDSLDLVTEAAKKFGSQSIVVSIDTKKDWIGNYKVYRNNGKKKTSLSPVELAKKVELAGAGEIMLTAIDKDGTYLGYDIDITKQVSNAVNLPLIACGGASELTDFVDAINIGGASAVAAGSFFVFQKPLRAVLINYPSQKVLKNNVYSKL